MGANAASQWAGQRSALGPRRVVCKSGSCALTWADGDEKEALSHANSGFGANVEIIVEYGAGLAPLRVGRMLWLRK